MIDIHLYRQFRSIDIYLSSADCTERNIEVHRLTAVSALLIKDPQFELLYKATHGIASPTTNKHPTPHPM